MTVFGVALAGVATGLFALARPFWSSCCSRSLGGVAIGALNVCESTVIQENAPDDDARARLRRLRERLAGREGDRRRGSPACWRTLVGISALFLAVSLLVLICALILALSPVVRNTR